MIKLRDNNGNVVGTIQDSGEIKFDDEVIKREFERAEQERNAKQQ